MTPFFEALMEETLDTLHDNLRDMYEIDDVSYTSGDVDYFIIPVFFTEDADKPDRRPCDKFTFGRSSSDSDEEARKWWQINLKNFLSCYGKQPPKSRRGKRTKAL